LDWWRWVLIAAMPATLAALAILNTGGLTDLWTGAAAGVIAPLISRIRQQRRRRRAIP